MHTSGYDGSHGSSTGIGATGSTFGEETVGGMGSTFDDVVGGEFCIGTRDCVGVCGASSIV